VIREWIGSLVLRAYPPEARGGRGPEMLGMLLDAGEQSELAFARECASLVAGGLRERRAAMTARRLLGLRILIAATAVIVAIGAITTSNETPRTASSTSNIRLLAAQFAPHLRRGDIVVVAQPEETSLAARDLSVGMRVFMPPTPYGQATLTYSEWREYVRLAGHDPNPRASLGRLVKSLAPGQHVLFIRPLSETRAGFASLSYRSELVRRRDAQLGALLAGDPELRSVAWAPHTLRNIDQPSCCTDVAVLYVKS